MKVVFGALFTIVGVASAYTDAEISVAVEQIFDSEEWKQSHTLYATANAKTQCKMDVYLWSMVGSHTFSGVKDFINDQYIITKQQCLKSCKEGCSAGFTDIAINLGEITSTDMDGVSFTCTCTPGKKSDGSACVFSKTLSQIAQDYLAECQA